MQPHRGSTRDGRGQPRRACLPTTPPQCHDSEARKEPGWHGLLPGSQDVLLCRRVTHLSKRSGQPWSLLHTALSLGTPIAFQLLLRALTNAYVSVHGRDVSCLPTRLTLTPAALCPAALHQLGCFAFWPPGRVGKWRALGSGGERGRIVRLLSPSLAV